MENTYWNSKGKYQAAADELNKLVPTSGACDKPRSKNKALDKFRRAVNCYYDLYNNGLWNRAQEFRRMFDLIPSYYKIRYSSRFDNSIYTDLEPKMDAIVLAAAEEQGIKINDVVEV